MALGAHTENPGDELIDATRPLYHVVRRRQQGCVIGIECRHSLRVAAVERRIPSGESSGNVGGRNPP